MNTKLLLFLITMLAVLSLSTSGTVTLASTPSVGITANEIVASAPATRADSANDRTGESFARAETSTISIVSDSSWRVSSTLVSGWTDVDFDDSAWEYTVAPNPGDCGWTYCLFVGSGATPMWNQAESYVAYFRKSFYLSASRPLESAVLLSSCDDDYDIYINGVLAIANWNGWADPYQTTDVKQYLRTGKNTIAAKGQDTAGGCRNICMRLTISLNEPSDASRFLELPFDYGGSQDSFVKGLQDTADGGRVSSWFDHKYPDYGADDKPGMWLYNAKFTDERHFVGSKWCYGKYCYDGHNGVDLVGTEGQSLHAGAAGQVAMSGREVAVKSNCNVSNPCAGYGNYVVVYHEAQGYFTRYAHLANVLVGQGTSLTLLTPIGTLGNTGNSSGPHVHMSVHRDSNGNGLWDGENIDMPIDPFGWAPNPYEPDPWVIDKGGPVSYPLWLYNPANIQSYSGSEARLLTDATNQIHATVPANTFPGQVTLELSPGPVAVPSAQLRSAGQPFWLRLIQWIQGRGAQDRVQSATGRRAMSIGQPVSLQVIYADNRVRHLDQTQLTVYWWNSDTALWEPLHTTVDAGEHVANATSPALGDFSLLAPLVCPADLAEPDDVFYRSTLLLPGSTHDSLFDIADDQDWYSFEGTAGASYILQTSNLASGVDTVMKLYGPDAATVLATDDNGGVLKASRIVWQASQTATFFFSVEPAAGSAYGCAAAYYVSISQQSPHLYMPFIRR